MTDSKTLLQKELNELFDRVDVVQKKLIKELENEISVKNQQQSSLQKELYKLEQVLQQEE